MSKKGGNNARSQAAKKIAAERLAKDPDYFKKLAQRVRRRGRQASAPSGFAANPEIARIAGSKSRKNKSSAGEDSEENQIETMEGSN